MIDISKLYKSHSKNIEEKKLKLKLISHINNLANTMNNFNSHKEYMGVKMPDFKNRMNQEVNMVG